MEFVQTQALTVFQKIIQSKSEKFPNWPTSLFHINLLGLPKIMFSANDVRPM